MHKTKQKYLVIKFRRFSESVEKQQLMTAQHYIIVEDVATQTPANEVECQLVTAVLGQHLDAQSQQVRKFNIPDE